MRLALAGTGQIVRELIPHLREWGWEIAALNATPRSLEKGRELSERYGGFAVYSDYTSMLGMAEADAVYLGVPNALHASMAKQALLSGWNVIVEKPLTSNLREAEEIAALARKERRFLYEAITTIHQPGYAILKEQLPRIGKVKLVSCNFSQYSSRYDAFRSGETPPAFDPAQSGGALMDLNLYNVQWLLGLFGSPEQVAYWANLERGIDTSGILYLKYPGFQAVSIAAKDCRAPSRYLIQGTDGCLLQETPANQCGEVTLHLNNGMEERFHIPTEHRMEAEFRVFSRQIQAQDFPGCEALLTQSLNVSRVLTQARQSAGIRFPADDRK